MYVPVAVRETQLGDQKSLLYLYRSVIPEHTMLFPAEELAAVWAATPGAHPRIAVRRFSLHARVLQKRNNIRRAVCDSLSSSCQPPNPRASSSSQPPPGILVYRYMYRFVGFGRVRIYTCT